MFLFPFFADAAQLQEFSDRRFIKQVFNAAKKKSRIPVIGKLVKQSDKLLDSLKLDVELDIQDIRDESAFTGESGDVFFHEGYEDSMVPKTRKRFGR